jgi:protein TonB
MIPLLAADAILPARLAVIAYYAAPPLPPRLPSRTAPAKPSLPSAKPSIPLDAPQGIAAEIPIPSTDDPFAAVDDNAGVVQGGEVPGLLPSPAAAPTPEQTPVRVGSGIQRPTKVKDAIPAYPALARAAHVEGIVIVEATIGPNGKVQDARILRSIQLLDAAALDAVRQWEYIPTLLNGVPIAVVMTVTVDFRLR